MAKLQFITGGVRSGKSAFAEQLSKTIVQAEQRFPIYIATGVAFDNEMKYRIERHQLDRHESGLHWKTIEMSVHFPEDIHSLQTHSFILFECITTWLSNLLFETETVEKSLRNEMIHNAITTLKESLISWRSQDISVIIVSNEVLDDGVSNDEETALYQQLVGQLHQWLVANCDEVFEVNAQIIEQWK